MPNPGSLRIVLAKGHPGTRSGRAPGDPLTALDDGASEGHEKDCDAPRG
jgi:hypothetical protein